MDYLRERISKLARLTHLKLPDATSAALRARENDAPNSVIALWQLPARNIFQAACLIWLYDECPSVPITASCGDHLARKNEHDEGIPKWLKPKISNESFQFYVRFFIPEITQTQNF